MVSVKADSASTAASSAGQGRVSQTAVIIRLKLLSASSRVLRRPRQASSVSVKAQAITPSTTGISSSCQPARQPSASTQASASRACMPRVTPS